MTHPDILAIERTGYPPGGGSVHIQECKLCGDLAVTDNEGLCEGCRPVECLMCGDHCPADETESGICEGCLTERASNRGIAIAYAMYLGIKGSAWEIAENATWAIFNPDGKANTNVFTEYSFFTAECAEIIEQGLEIGKLTAPGFCTVDRDTVSFGIRRGLRELCIGDKGSFAKWLVRGAVG